MPARFLLRENFWKSGGPFIGPRGGKWADAEHKVPWKPEGEKAGMHGLSASQWATAGEHFQNLADKNTGHMASHMNGLAAIAHHYAQGGGDGGASAIYAAKVSESGNPEMANRAHQAVEYIGERAKKLHEAAQGASIPESAPVPEPPKPQIAQVAEAQPGAPKGWVGDPIKTGDHLIVGTHKFVAVTAPQIDEHMTGVMGSKIPYFNVKLKRPAGHKIFEATVSVWNGQPRWRITDKGKPIVGDYSGGGDGHKVVSAEEKAPKVESTPTPPIGKAGKVDIPAVPTGMASSWHQRWASGYTTPEPASATFQKTAANYLLKQHEQGMTADDHMEAAKFHSDYGAEVMAGTKLPSLPHKGVRKERMLLHDQLADWHNKMATSPGFIEKLYAVSGRKPKVKKSLNEETDMEKALSGIDDLGEYLEKAGGPFIGPRGGKWADAGHKIPWKEQESDLTRFMDQRKARKWTDAEAAEFKTRQEQLGRAVATEADKLVEEIKGYQSATPAALSPKDYDDFDTAVGQLRDIHQKLKVAAEVAHKEMQTSGDQGDAELANHLAATLHHVEWALGMKGQSGMLKPPGYQSSNQQAKKSMDAIDQLDDYLEKAFPPPAAPATPGIGPGQAPVPPGGIGGAYTRRWKGPAGKWLYESDHPDHKQAIDASNTAETHPGTAGDLIGAHQNATQAHMKAAQSLKDDPTLSAEHYQVGADHAKAAAIVTTSYMAHKAQGAFGAQPGQPPAPGQPMPPPGQPPVAGQPPAPGQPPVPPGQPPLAKGPVPPGQPPMPGQQPGQPPVAKPPVPPPGQFGAQPGQMAPPAPKPAPGMPPAQMQPAAGAPQAPQPDPGMKTVPTNPGGGQTPAGPPVANGKPVPEKKENPFQKKEKVRKSMEAIEQLDEYLAKAQSMPEGGPKEKLGTGEEQGGKVDGVGETSGEDDSDSKQPGAPSVPEDVLSDDDDKVSDQLKPGKKPIETAKSMAIHQNQRDMVRKEVAQAVSELRKSQDVEFGRGVAPERSAPAPRPEGIIWNQGADALVTYTNQADLAASELAKSEGFYHGESPQVAPTSLFLSQRVRCTSCHNLMAKSLAVCPSCGDGAQRTLQDVVNTSEHEQLAQGSRAGMLRPARTQGDVYFPGDK